MDSSISADRSTGCWKKYDSDVIRINSQSGKGGVNYILKQSHGINLPKEMREEVGYLVERYF